MELTLEQFAGATGASSDNAAKYLDHAVAAMVRFQIDSVDAIAAFCATISVETAKLTAMEEDLFYRDPARLAQLFKRVFDENHDGTISAQEIEDAKAYCRNPKALSKALYNGFHGRGGAMLTWEKNYRLHGDKLGFDYVAEPALLITPVHAMLTAGSFYDEINGNAVAHDMGELTLRWNGPKRLALAERIAQRDTALTFLT